MHTVYTYTVVALCFIVIVLSYLMKNSKCTVHYCIIACICYVALMPKIGTERGTAGVCVRVRVRVCVHVCACV